MPFFGGARVVDGMMSRTVSDAEEDEEVEFDAKGHGNSNGGEFTAANVGVTRRRRMSSMLHTLV